MKLQRICITAEVLCAITALIFGAILHRRTKRLHQHCGLWELHGFVCISLNIMNIHLILNSLMSILMQCVKRLNFLLNILQRIKAADLLQGLLYLLKTLMLQQTEQREVFVWVRQ